MLKLNKVFSILGSVSFTLALASILCVIIFHQISTIAAYIGSVFFILMVVSIVGWLLTYDWSIYNKDDTNQWGD